MIKDFRGCLSSSGAKHGDLTAGKLGDVAAFSLLCNKEYCNW